MEFWSFPPNYDDTYFPPAESQYWFPRRELMPPAEREDAILLRIQEVMQYAYANSSFYRRKWDEAGIHPNCIRNLEDFEQVPVVTKEELRAAQERMPPFGDYLCVPDSEICHIHGTSGTTGRPTAFGIGRRDWRSISNAHARIMWGMGLRPGDTVFVAAILSLYMGSWGALIGSERLHAKAFPFGAGASGMTSRAAMWMKTVRPTALYSTPTYAINLAEVAQSEGIDPHDFGIRVLFFSGEPGGSIPEIRHRIKAAYGGEIIDCGTMAEVTPFMSASGSAGTPEGMLLWQDIVYTEICDSKSYCRVSYGDQGTPIYTTLERTSQPMIRLLSNDLSHWEAGPTPCGRTYPWLPKGIYGRIDDVFQVRGENIYPSEIDTVLNGLTGYGGEHRIIISRESTMDELLVRVECSREVHFQGQEGIARLKSSASESLRRVTGVRVKVEIVEPGLFPRTDFKARRVIDDRDLFRSLNVRLGEMNA
jgi:phenylacetate-CoA ligase